MGLLCPVETVVGRGGFSNHIHLDSPLVLKLRCWYKQQSGVNGPLGCPLPCFCWSINLLHVLGDSRLIIDWISKKSDLQTVHNESWKVKVLELSKNFTDVNYLHIPRSLNAEADALSKLALKGVVGRLTVFHRDRGIESPSTSINVFE
jgi:hypothetical protein